MMRSVSLLSLLAAAAFAVVACSAEDRSKMIDEVKNMMPDIDLAAVKQKAEALTGDGREKALKLVADLAVKKEAAAKAIGRLADAGKGEFLSLLNAAKDRTGDLSKVWAEVKKLLGL